MPIVVKKTISTPKKKTKNITAVDMEKLIAALDKLGSWGSYEAKPTATPKLDKAKKVTEVTIKATPTVTKPKWTDYGKTTTKRQAEWDKMFGFLETYLTNQHDKFVKAVDAFADELKDQDLDKAAFDKLWKQKQAAIKKVHDDYASTTSNGETLGVKLELIDPDPAEVKKDIKAPSVSDTNVVSAKSISAVFDALEKKRPWGKYRSNMDYTPKFAHDGCLKKITISSSSKITMPKWKEFSKMNADQKASWNTMYAALLKHEHNHHDKFVTAMDEFLAEVKDAGLDKAALKALWTTRKKDLKKTQDDYDASSDNGGNEGVILDANADPEEED